MTGDEAALLAQMRAAPDDPGPQLVYADWLLARGDVRGELIVLDHRDRAGQLAGVDEIDRLLRLAAEHGFPRLPDDPDAAILPWYGGGSFPVQYVVDHDGHHYYVRWRGGFSVEVDHHDVLDTRFDFETTGDWTFRETNAVLAILSDEIRRDPTLATLAFPDGDGLRAHPAYRVGRFPAFVIPEAFLEAHDARDARWSIAVRDFTRWYTLYDRWAELRGLATIPWRHRTCGCGVPGIACRVSGCS